MKMRSWTSAVLLAMAAQVAHAAAPRATDAEAMWREFLAKGDYSRTMAAYAVLPAVGYDGEQVDSARCASNVAALDAAIADAPVSIALRRAAYLCADAGNDPAATERSLEVLAALSRHALKQAGEIGVAKPIRVVAPADAYALLLGSGMEETYEYYFLRRPARYFPVVMVGWDAESETERHLAFDYVDTLQQLRSEREFQGMPIVREAIAEAFVGDGGSLASLDIAALRAAAGVNATADQLAKLRGAAATGGVQAATQWLQLCAGRQAPKGCTDGLLDALLTQAEQKRALPMVLLAFAYADGVGTKADPVAALALLDAAERRWPGNALARFEYLWVTAHGDAPAPAGLRERLDSTQAAAAPALRRVRLLHEAQKEKPQLGEADIAFLADPAQNGTGIGYSTLISYYAKRDEQAEMWKWTAKAAEAGNAEAQGWQASALIFGNEKFVPKDVEKGRAMAMEAAQGGEEWAAQWLAHQAVLAGDFKAAEGWLVEPADAGHIDTIMQLAGLYLEERPGVTGDVKRAVEVYRMLADLGASGAPARRALAHLAVLGIGMPKDPAQAIAWLKPDAEGGDAESQVALAGYYLKGDFGKVDEAEGTRWIKRAIKAGDEDAVTAYGSWLYYTKDTPESRAQALEMLTRADAAGNQGATNNYAWILCTSPLKEVYDPKRGLELIQRLGDVDRLGAGTLDTVAACHAANGDFARAVELQTRAARELSVYESPREAKERGGKEPGHARRLALYKAGKRYEEFERNQ